MPEKHFPTTRLEAFTDGVLAIVLTIMVLELKVPHENGMAGLLSIAPMLFIYLLSFCFGGIYWVNHHYLIRRIERCDHRVLYANLLFLFAASLLPFLTAYVIEKESDSFSVSIYAASMIFTALTFFLLRLAVERLLRSEGRLIPSDVATQRKHMASLALYGAAVPLAHFHSYIALGLITLVTIIWIMPTASTEHCPPDVLHE
ncbi:MAG: TMEM175 family protein [Edaphobacter sp.]|uniref:TMEM175 family protein n=1 Tax=Edaphobacter sp. TaxID=1934404 RepID=UPI0023A297C2|nr:TMEM175 family protein [Edaphobacter sp.]MDE1177031.1 TMEM175 family protein [Edaphobacter sp.]